VGKPTKGFDTLELGLNFHAAFNLLVFRHKVTAELWERKNAEWLQQEQQVQFVLAGLNQADEPARLLTASRTLELANKAYSLYVRQKPAEQAKLLKMVLSNCKIDALSLTPAYRKPLDVIFTRVRNEEWRAR